MLKLLNKNYSVHFDFNIEDIDPQAKILTLFYELNLNFEKFFIQYYSNSLMGKRININNKSHLPIINSKKILKFSICMERNYVYIYLNKRLVDKYERKNRILSLVLIGKPFFGKTLKTFLQYFYQSSVRYLTNIVIDNSTTARIPTEYIYSNKLEKYNIDESSNGLLNVLDRSSHVNPEILNNYGQFHKLTHEVFVDYLDNELSSCIKEEVDYLKKYINLEVSQICHLDLDSLLNSNIAVIDREYLLGHIYLSYDAIEHDYQVYLDIVNTILTENQKSKIALLVAAHIYSINKNNGPLVRIIREINDSRLNSYLIENYFIFIYAVSKNKQIEYFINNVAELTDSIDDTNSVYFGIVVSMLDILFSSYHYSKRGAEFKSSIDALLIKLKRINTSKNREYWDYSIGILNMMAQRPKIASKFFRRLSNIYPESSYYLITSLESCGEIKEARDILLANIKSTGRVNATDNLVSHYTTIDNWLNNEVRFDWLEFNSTEHDFKYLKIKCHENLNFESIDNVYIADHDFTFKFRMERAFKEGDILQYSKNFRLYISSGFINFRCEIDKNIYELSVGLDSGLQDIEISRRCDKLILICNEITRVVSIPKNGIIYGGKLLIYDLNNSKMEYSLNIFDYDKSEKSSSIVIYSSWYGDEFTDLFFNSLLPSLNRPDSLKSLRENFNIEWKIYTTKEQLKRIQSKIGDIKDLVNSININTDILKSDYFEPREYLHETFIDCIKQSLDSNSIIIFAPPDHIFGDGLRSMIETSKVDSYTICAHPRISYEDAFLTNEYKFLIYQNGIDDADGYVKNNQLLNFALFKYPHPIVCHGIKPEFIDGDNEFSYWWSAEIIGSTVEVRFKEPPPVLLYARRDIISGMLSEGYSSTFERVDHDLVEWMYKTKRLNVIANNNVFSWLEYCKNNRNVPTLMNGYWNTSASKIYSNKHKWDISAN